MRFSIENYNKNSFVGSAVPVQKDVGNQTFDIKSTSAQYVESCNSDEVELDSCNVKGARVAQKLASLSEMNSIAAQKKG